MQAYLDVATTLLLGLSNLFIYKDFATTLQEARIKIDEFPPPRLQLLAPISRGGGNG